MPNDKLKGYHYEPVGKRYVPVVMPGRKWRVKDEMKTGRPLNARPPRF
jgi:hypothetical protein